MEGTERRRDMKGEMEVEEEKRKTISSMGRNQPWWRISIIPGLGRLRQEDTGT